MSYYENIFDNQMQIIEEQQKRIKELEKYKALYLEEKEKYAKLLVFGVVVNNEKLKRMNYEC